MDRRPLHLDDEGRLTLRLPLGWPALLAALLVHALAVVVILSLPEPKPPPTRVELTVNRRPPPPPSSPGPRKEKPSTPPAAPPKVAKRPRVQPKPPPPAPVVPELPPSEDPPENRAQLPVVEQTPPVPAPPPEPSTWEERLRAQLAATTPKRRAPVGVLAPSGDTLQRVANADPRLHDEETERRLMTDFSVFFRRGLEALRGNWHPDTVLQRAEQRVAARCAGKTRTTYAVAVLDKEGNVVDVELKAPSGCPGLDEEAIAAFKRVARFPYPPPGIFLGPDGTELETARYPVRFIVTFDGLVQLDWG